MTVSSLSSVTSSLETLFKENIEQRLSNTVTVATSALSPLDVTPSSHLVNIFLFHFHPEGKPSIHENHAIDPPRPASFSKPLTLYYHLTAHHSSTTGAHLVDQDLLGHAMATLLDYSEVDDALTIGGVPILDGGLTEDGNAFELEVLTKTDSEALNVWAGYEGGAIRPSLYFKVKNVRLRPEVPQSFAGPIVSIGQLVVPSMGSRLAFVQSTITASVPTDGGPVARQFKRAPAELFIGAGAPDATVWLKGSAIDQFAAVDLTVPVGNGSETIRVDFAANAAQGWAIRDDNGGVAIDWGSAISRPVSAVPITHQLEPGAGQIRMLKTEYLARDGARVPVEMPSNPIAITFHPFISGIAPMAERRFRINLAGAYDLTTLAPVVEHQDFVRLVIGSTVYEVIDAIGGLVAGQCAISGAQNLDFILAATADETALAYVQLWVRDAVSQPFWIGGS